MVYIKVKGGAAKHVIKRKINNLKELLVKSRDSEEGKTLRQKLNDLKDDIKLEEYKKHEKEDLLPKNSGSNALRNQKRKIKRQIERLKKLKMRLSCSKKAEFIPIRITQLQIEYKQISDLQENLSKISINQAYAKSRDINKKHKKSGFNKIRAHIVQGGLPSLGKK